MKTTFLLSVLLLFFSPAIHGQNTISSQSNTYQDENIQYDFILGEIFTGSVTDNTTILTTGFFQSTDTYYPIPNNCEIEVLNLSSHTNGVSFYNASEQVLSTAIVQKEENIKYISGATITLSPGFHAQKESAFTAILVGCTPDLSNPLQPVVPLSALIKPTNINNPLSLKISPNPSQNKIQVDFSIHEKSTDALISIYNATGNLMDNINLGHLTKGKYSKRINLIPFGKGSYFISLSTSNNLITVPLIIIN